MKLTNKEKKYMEILRKNENKWIATSESRDILFSSDKSLARLLKKLKANDIDNYVLTSIPPEKYACIF